MTTRNYNAEFKTKVVLKALKEVNTQALESVGDSMIERKRGNFILNEAKNVGDAIASARLFNEVQEKICRLQPFDDPAEQVY